MMCLSATSFGIAAYPYSLYFTVIFTSYPQLRNYVVVCSPQEI
jgi:hypothetical protein